jgi:hydrogenase maturation protein HypF
MTGVDRRLAVAIRGAVQGVGFRPFVFLLAEELGLRGWVQNDARGVALEAEGPEESLRRFLERLRADKPAHAVIDHLDAEWLEAKGLAGFEIRRSEAGGEKSASVLPDLALCAACRADVESAANRRRGYPFTNCTHCGPRFSILRALPYDRPNTTMAGFALCGACRAEYDDPRDRRFHAQPTACAECGPRLALWAPDGTEVAREAAALEEAAHALAQGQIVALKGLGGFQLLVDARSGEAVSRLRERKHRWGKPLAVMVRDLAAARELCEVDEAAAALLTSAQAPIVLLPERAEELWPNRGGGQAPALRSDAESRLGPETNRRAGACPPPQHGDDATPLEQSAGGKGHSSYSASPVHPERTGSAGSVSGPNSPGLAVEVAAGSPDVGLMLPTTPLHHLLLARVGFPLVATSGNLSDEPLCTDEREALGRLAGIADLFLVHDRPIERHVDDSVAFVFRGAPRLLRRARGHAPLPVRVARDLPPILAVGAHLKNVVALSAGRNVFLSQHIGDLETPSACAAFERVIADFLRLYAVTPAAIAHDLHPDLASTQGAEAHATAPLVAVQHHHAHFAACLADNGVDGPALGVTWDGTGLGPDGTIWGGEFLVGGFAAAPRVACLRPFRLPGADAAVREPRRSALALLFELLGPAGLERDDLAAVQAVPVSERKLLGQMLERGLNAPLTTSAGRLFDGVAALVGLHPKAAFDGQAAMALEHLADRAETGAYPLPLEGGSLDWRPLLEALLEDQRRRVPAPLVAARFHNALAQAIVAVARSVGERRVALSGGCFQNRLLTARACDGLERAGFEVLLHRQVPANDGGLSLGQVLVAAAKL